MGIELNVSFSTTDFPPWHAVVERLATRSIPVQMRMIDGELAFPDEQPPENWRELRVASSGAMVTLRRGAAGVAVVGWGNMDQAHRRLWRSLAWALASAGHGQIAEEGNVRSADEFDADLGP